MTVRHDVAHMREVEEALRRSEAKYRGIFENIQDIFFQTNDQGLIVEVSPSVERYGYTREELIGMPATRVYEDPGKRITLLQLLEDGDMTDREVRLRARDGRVLDLSISAHLLRGPDGSPAGMDGCLRDISDRKRAEEALRRSERELTIRNKIADVFLTVPDEEMYGEALQVILEALASRHGVFGYIDENGALVCASMTWGIWEECQIPDKKVVYPPEQWGGIWGRALTEKKSLYSNEPGRVPEGHIPMLNSLAVPIIHRKRVIGLLHVANKETGYDESVRRLLETIAGHIAPILRARLQRDRQEGRRRRAEEELKRHRDRLEELIDERTAELRQTNERLLREVEERRQAEEALRESEESFRQVLDVSSDLICKVDLASSACDYVSPAVLPLTGFTQEEFAALGIRDYLLRIHPDDRPQYKQRIDDFLRQGSDVGAARQHEYRWQCKDGQYRWFSDGLALVRGEGGQPLALVVDARDTTERRQAEEALRESEERFRTLYESSRDGIAAADLDGYITECNPAYADTLGYTREELRGIRFQDITPSKWSALNADFVRQVMEHDCSDEFEKEYIRKDGAVFPVSLRSWRIEDKDGEPVGVWSIVRDITERKRAEEQARQLHAEHVRANELRRMVRILEQMAATLGHELRNPLGVISNSVYFLANQAQLDGPKAQKHVLIIGREVAGAKRVIDDILEFAHVPELLPAAAGIDAIVDSALTRSQIPANIRVLRKLAVDLPPIICDEERLERACIDIITNAVQAMPHGGRLGVKTCRSGDKIQVVFADSGAGIASENLDKVFEPMFTTKLRGMGLGLTVVRRTVEQHGGSISVRSRPGRGAIFTIVLPRDCRPFDAEGGRVA